MNDSCAVKGCTGKHHANGLCHWHTVNEPDPVLLRKPKPKPKRSFTVKRDTSPSTSKTRWRVRCEHCGGPDPRKSFRLDRNLKPSFMLLDKPCRERLGYQLVSYERPYAEITARSIMRGAA